MERRPLILATLAALVLALAIVVVAVLPAEFNKDPTGAGRLTGLSRLWAPKETAIDPNQGAVRRARFSETPYRTDVIEIPLTGPEGGYSGQELEYKVRMRRDAVLVYAWEAVGEGKATDLRFDFHGHTTPTKEKPSIDVSSYRADYGRRGSGSLVAPFDGIHGWQFSNTTDKPLVVRVRLSGFYELIPAGQEGNTEGVVANVPAAQARPQR